MRAKILVFRHRVVAVVTPATVTLLPFNRSSAHLTRHGYVAVFGSFRLYVDAIPS